MNKSTLIQHIASIAGLTKTQADDALDAFCTIVQSELAHGGTVEIKGFGSFSTTQRAERVGRNPKTGEPVVILASRAPKFKAGKSLKDGVA
ncbi:HU family DNA-binding protein [Alysiella crassa]|uniref:DNA-binding protein HU n=1 Tax=Alysiella crassa TaxID=153491 RepID=A0A376BUP2_9NEIS|nr:HU family DNA-binding protein [Alysiella crassa]UOP06187.1 HU family DNA-binding protein [Alysiella crassa]SSY80660.1 DNA-binding protein HU [Alysiella crassa]